GEALRVAEAFNNDEGRAVLTGNQADLAILRCEWPRAFELAQAALSLAVAVGRQELIAGCHRCSAQSLLGMGRPAEALLHARKSVELYDRMASPDVGDARLVLRDCEVALDPPTPAPDTG